eukprot:6484281-Lingulodinium_polyedra.AAC.1
MPWLLRELEPPPGLGDDRPALLIYADNANHYGLSQELVDDQRKALSSELNARGLVAREVVAAARLAESLG